MNIELNIKRGTRLKESRKEKHITQEKLSKLSGYTKNHISYVENGKRGLTIEAARIYAKILGVRENYLLCEDDFKTDNDYIYSIKRINHSEEYIISLINELEFGVAEIGDYRNTTTVSYKSFEGKVEEEECINVLRWLISKDDQTVYSISDNQMQRFFKNIRLYILFCLTEMLSDASIASPEEKEYYDTMCTGKYDSKYSTSSDDFCDYVDEKEKYENMLLDKIYTTEKYKKLLGKTNN